MNINLHQNTCDCQCCKSYPIGCLCSVCDLLGRTPRPCYYCNSPAGSDFHINGIKRYVCHRHECWLQLKRDNDALINR